jgi:hypothetical protein
MENTNHYKTDHVNHDSVLCLAPGLFRSVSKGEAKKTLMDITHEIPGQATYRFLGPVLTPRELRILQGLVAISAVCGSNSDNKILLHHDTISDVGKEHRRTLELEGAASEKPALVVKTTFYELGKEIGWADTSFDSGKQINQLKDAMERLWAVSIIVKDLKTEATEGSRLLSKYGATKDGKFIVAINFHVAETILGVRKKYTRLDMAEIRALKTDQARLIHQRLCGWIDPGKTGKIGLEGLCEYIWHEPTFKPSSLRSRRQRARKALKELEGLAWSVNEYVESKFIITRRPMPN